MDKTNATTPIPAVRPEAPNRDNAKQYDQKSSTNIATISIAVETANPAASKDVM